jgi:predicted nucleotidyltransferase
MHEGTQARGSAPDAGDADFYATLARSTSALQKAGIPYLVIGGLASALLGRERRTRDVDLFVKQTDAEAVLDRLSEVGFATERTNRDWIYKAFLHNIQLDVIFVAKGMRLDDEMLARGVIRSVGGVALRVMSPEDLIVLKALSHDEQTPRHWFDGLGILARQELDWGYLCHRARHHPSRVASLLFYGRAQGLRVPGWVLRQLVELATPGEPRAKPRSQNGHGKPLPPEPYLGERVRAALATDRRTSELGLGVRVCSGRLFLSGVVASEERRDAVLSVIAERWPSLEVRNDLRVQRLGAPDAEVLR